MEWIAEHAFELGILLALLLIVGLLLLVLLLILYPYIKDFITGNLRRREKKHKETEQFREQLKHDKILGEALVIPDPVAEKVAKNIRKRRAKEETQKISPPLKTTPGDIKSTPMVAPGDAGAVVIARNKAIGIAVAGSATDISWDDIQTTRTL